jgi:hypothetical protein
MASMSAFDGFLDRSTRFLAAGVFTKLLFIVGTINQQSTTLGEK